MVDEEDTMSFQTAAATPQIGNGHHDALVLADAGDDLWLVRAKQGFGARPAAPTEGNA
jgi:hypothetical protein